MIYRTIIIFLILLLFNFESRAQSTTRAVSDTIIKVKKNSVFLEIGGNAFLYSINYDRLFDFSPKFKASGRIGFQYTNKFPLKYYKTVSIPVELSGLYSIYEQKHFAELGLGLTYLNSHDLVTQHTEDIIVLAFRAGYRFQKPEGGLYFKIAITPLYDWLIYNRDPEVPHNKWLIFGGVSFGYTF